MGSLSSPKEVSTSISTPNSTSNHVVLSRQRSMKRGGGSSSHNNTPANDSLSQAPPIQQGAVVDAPPPNPGKSGGSVGEPSRDNTNKDAGQRGGSYGGNESQPHRGSFRRNNSGSLHRGDGSHHGTHGGRRDQERGNHHRSFGSRDSHGPQQRVGSRPFLRGPAPNAPFIPPPPPVGVRPFVPPVVYTGEFLAFGIIHLYTHTHTSACAHIRYMFLSADSLMQLAEMPSPVFYVPGPHPDSLRPMPMVPISSMFFPMPDPHLPSKIVNQIDYYFRYYLLGFFYDLAFHYRALSWYERILIS